MSHPLEWAWPHTSVICGLIACTCKVGAFPHLPHFITHHPSLIRDHPSLTTHQSPLITHRSPLKADTFPHVPRVSSLITHHSSLITHHSSLITHHPSLITHHSKRTHFHMCPGSLRAMLHRSPVITYHSHSSPSLITPSLTLFTHHLPGRPHHHSITPSLITPSLLTHTIQSSLARAATLHCTNAGWKPTRTVPRDFWLPVHAGSLWPSLHGLPPRMVPRV